MKHQQLDRLKGLDREIRKLASIGEVLAWDQETGMPEQEIAGRSAQLALIEGMVHDRTAGDEMGELLSSIDSSQLDGEGDVDAALLAYLRREHQRAKALPRRLVTELAERQSLSQAAWLKARGEDSFDDFLPHLKGLLELNREKADAWGWEGEPYNALLDEYEPYMDAETIAPLFSELASSLKKLMGRIEQQTPIDDAFLFEAYPVERQKALSRRVAERMGYDFSRGNISESAHPFTIRPGDDDVRITTAYDEHALKAGLFGTIHEAGHAIYEQAIERSLVGSCLGQGTSLGIHESQSRTWENIIGRSRGFWEYFFPEVQQLFPEQLSGQSVDSFYRAVNRVQASLIRIEADEVSYSLHIILRFELERALVNGDLLPQDLSAAWNEKSSKLLGIVPNRAKDGVLQDIHWAMGAFGYFPTYALGNLYGAQIWDALSRDLGDPEKILASGDFSAILSWLREQVYQYGSRYAAEPLVKRVSGQPLSAEFFSNYLERKYTEVYGL